VDEPWLPLDTNTIVPLATSAFTAVAIAIVFAFALSHVPEKSALVPRLALTMSASGWLASTQSSPATTSDVQQNELLPSSTFTRDDPCRCRCR
jgi:hypothetical protein